MWICLERKWSDPAPFRKGPVSHSSIPVCPKQSQAQSGGKKAISSMFVLQHGQRNTEGARELPDSAEAGDKPLQRTRCSADSSRQVSSESKSLWQGEHFCSADVPPPGSHSVCVVVTQFPSGKMPSHAEG